MMGKNVYYICISFHNIIFWQVLFLFNQLDAEFKIAWILFTSDGLKPGLRNI